MKPTEVLKEEHHGVKLSLRALGKLCEKMAAEGKLWVVAGFRVGDFAQDLHVANLGE